MCVPKPPPVVAQPTAVPSMEAASSLSLANANRGASGLGRLALRIGGGSSAQTATTAAATPSATPAPVAASTVAPAPSNLASAQQSNGVGTLPGSLAGLRFGNYTGGGFI